MGMVRTKEQQAEAIGHLLDDMVRVPGSRMTTGLDPLLGLLPVVGDGIAALLGASLLVLARQLRVPWPVVLRMGWNYCKNGIVGAVPIIGDIYSFHFKSNALNAALVLRAVKDGEEGACPLVPDSITLMDVAVLLALIVPVLVLIGSISWWFWEHNLSIVSFLFMPPYTRRG